MLKCISERGTEDPENTKLLAALALGVVKHLGGESAEVEEDGSIRMGWRMARVGALALLEKPAEGAIAAAELARLAHQRGNARLQSL